MFTTDDEPKGYGNNAYQWDTVTMLYGDNQAYIARESGHNESDWDQAIATARADGFQGDIIFSHTDDYGDGDVSNYTISDALQINNTKVGHRSFSSMTSWIRCGKAWQLERDFKVPSQPAWWFVGGTSFHLAVERYLKATLRPEEEQE